MTGSFIGTSLLSPILPSQLMNRPSAPLALPSRVRCPRNAGRSQQKSSDAKTQIIIGSRMHQLVNVLGQRGDPLAQRRIRQDVQKRMLDAAVDFAELGRRGISRGTIRLRAFLFLRRFIGGI